MKTSLFRYPILAAIVSVAALLPPADAADTSTTKERTVTKVADGIWTIRHADSPDAFPQSNTVVVAGDRAVLVVDSGYLPSAARQDAETIRTLTSKPVRWLVNTHWHYDHTMGNAAYREAFPGVAVVAHDETRTRIADYNPGWFARFPNRAIAFRKTLESGKDGEGRTLSESEKEEYRNALAGLEPVSAEYRDLPSKLEQLAPDVSFDSSVRVDLGGRIAEIRHLGRGNTAGDAVVWLPKERILAAGDLVVHPVPYMGGGYPVEFAATLRRLRDLSPATIVPGHGNVLTGTAYVGTLVEFLETVTAEVDRQIHRLGNGTRNLEEVKKGVEAAIDVAAWRKRFAGDDPSSIDTFDGFSWPGLIRTTHAEMVRR